MAEPVALKSHSLYYLSPLVVVYRGGYSNDEMSFFCLFECGSLIFCAVFLSCFFFIHLGRCFVYSGPISWERLFKNRCFFSTSSSRISFFFLFSFFNLAVVCLIVDVFNFSVYKLTLFANFIYLFNILVFFFGFFSGVIVFSFP